MWWMTWVAVCGCSGPWVQGRSSTALTALRSTMEAAAGTDKAEALAALRADLDTQAYKDRETALSMQRVELEAEAGSVERHPTAWCTGARDVIRRVLDPPSSS